MKQIVVDPGRLVQTAQQIEQADGEYQHLYQSLYSEVDKMSQAWSGKDNTAFSNQIHSYEKDFRSISLLLRQYSEFLRNSARAYQDTQDEIYAQAAHIHL